MFLRTAKTQGVAEHVILPSSEPEKRYFGVYSVPTLIRSLLLQADGREVVKGSGIYKMVDPTMPTQSCSSGASAATTGGITNDVAVKEATRQRLRVMRNKAVYGLSDPL